MQFLAELLSGLFVGGRWPPGRALDPAAAVVAAVAGTVAGFVLAEDFFASSGLRVAAWCLIASCSTYIAATMLRARGALLGALLASVLALMLAIPLGLLDAMFSVWGS